MMLLGKIDLLFEAYLHDRAPIFHRGNNILRARIDMIMAEMS